jgi:hypothetical protein
MHDQVMLSLLEGVAEQLQIPVSYVDLATEELPGRGGLCVLRGERRIIIERTLSTRQKARLLAAGLAQFDLEGVFLLPAVRRAIEEARSDSRLGPHSGRCVPGA